MTYVPDGHIAISYQVARLVLDALGALEYHEQTGSDVLGGWDDGTLTALSVQIAGQLPESERPKDLRIGTYARFEAVAGNHRPVPAERSEP